MGQQDAAGPRAESLARGPVWVPVPLQGTGNLGARAASAEVRASGIIIGYAELQGVGVVLVEGYRVIVAVLCEPSACARDSASIT